MSVCWSGDRPWRAVASYTADVCRLDRKTVLSLAYWSSIAAKDGGRSSERTPLTAVEKVSLDGCCTTHATLRTSCTVHLSLDVTHTICSLKMGASKTAVSDDQG